MSFRYSPLVRAFKTAYRKARPVPVSSWTEGEVEDICSINLVPPDKLVSFFLSCLSILQKEKGDDVGDYLEFGVFNGNSIGSMYHALYRNDYFSKVRLFGFDAFEGLPAGCEDEDDGVWKKGFYACDLNMTEECLRRRNVNVASINWIKGWYDQTVNIKMFEQHQIKNISIAFIDCDTYSSSKTVLDTLAKTINKPLIICLDDWKLNDLDIKGQGEYKSFNEFVEMNPQFKVKEIPSYNRKSKSFLVSPLCYTKPTP